MATSREWPRLLARPLPQEPQSNPPLSRSAPYLLALTFPHPLSPSPSLCTAALSRAPSSLRRASRSPRPGSPGEMRSPHPLTRPSPLFRAMIVCAVNISLPVFPPRLPRQHFPRHCLRRGPAIHISGVPPARRRCRYGREGLWDTGASLLRSLSCHERGQCMCMQTYILCSATCNNRHAARSAQGRAKNINSKKQEPRSRHPLLSPSYAQIFPIPAVPSV